MGITRLPVWAKITTAGAVVAAAISGGVAFAATHVTAPKPGNYVLYGCIVGSTRTMEHFYTSASDFRTCPRGSHAVAFNSTGPRGLPGLAKVQADEPYGQNVDPNSNIKQSDGTVTAGRTAVIWAACPSGKTAIGGGFRIGDGTSADAAESDATGPGYTGSNVQVLASEPSYYDPGSGKLDLSKATQVTTYGSYLPNAWAVTVHNSGTSDANARVALVCATVSS